MDVQRWPSIEELFERAVPLAGESRARFLDQLRAEHASIADEVLRLLDAHEQPSGPLDRIAFHTCPIPAALPAEIGRYQVNRLLGAGGMGVVYEARQEMPRRLVALKVVRPGDSSLAIARRLEYEADLLGRLQHPGIAQIYEAGTAQTPLGEQPFFAMEYVCGQPIVDYASARNLKTHERLILLAAVCDAVEYAHRKGIIHRDLKPANILVDESGQPKILDFGIARATDSDIQATTLQTDIGQLVGTIPYMSPEQVGGDAAQLDTRSDVYALGVIAYELLTGSLPYDVAGKTIPEALRMIMEVQPAPLSRLNRHLRGDLEPVLAKALEKDRERRYGSARDFADDLRRYLAGEPVRARRMTRPQRAWRWCVRNPALAGALAVAAAFLFAGVGAVYHQWRVAQRNADIAAANFRSARDAVDQMLTQVGEESLENIPHMTPVRQALLEKALAFYHQLAAQQSRDPVLRYEVARAYRRVAAIRIMLGQEEAARQAEEPALAILEELVAGQPNMVTYRCELADSYREMARKEREARRFEQCEAYHVKALALLEPQVNDAARGDVRPVLAQVYNDYGLFLRDAGWLREAEKPLTRGLELRQQLAREEPGNRGHREALAHGHHWLAAVLMESGRHDEARRHLNECVQIRQQWVSEDPGSRQARANLAHVQLYLGRLLVQRSHYEEGQTILRRSIQIMEGLSNEYPEIPQYRTQLGSMHGKLGLCLQGLGRYEEAQQAMREHVRLLETALDLPGNRLWRAWAVYRLAVLLHESRKHDEAADRFHASFGFFEKLADESRAASELRTLAWILTTCPDPRLRDVRRAFALVEKAEEIQPNKGLSARTRGIAHYQAGAWKQAVVHLIGRADCESLFFLAMAHGQLGEREQAVQCYQRALRSQQKLHPGDEECRRFQREAAGLLHISPLSTTLDNVAGSR